MELKREVATLFYRTQESWFREMENERRIVSPGFPDLSSALSLTRLNQTLQGRLGLDALAASSGSVVQVPSRVIVHRMRQLLIRHILAANASSWGLTEHLLLKFVHFAYIVIIFIEIREGRRF
jgi:hypothetical protein